MFKKQQFAVSTALFLLCSLLYSQNIDYSVMLGFNGLYIEDAWTPLVVRLKNKGPSISGELQVITDNSGTATEQIREYIKPVDLQSGSDKILSFVIPIGHHNRDLMLKLTSSGEEIINDSIPLKQRGKRGDFIVVVSPYPDLSLSPEHPVLKQRIVTYPHPDNLPVSAMAYDGVSIISIHREYFDRLSNEQFESIAGWVSSGGVLAVWGGRSPSPLKRDYLPVRINGLRRISGSDLLVNTIDVLPENRLLLADGFEAGSLRRSGEGSIFFFPYDYSAEPLRDWPGLDEIWEIINRSVPEDDVFRSAMDQPFLLEDYITLFDNSEFAYLDRKNVALLLFLSASASISMLTMIRLRRDSRHIYRYISLFMVMLALTALTLFLTLYNGSFRKESFAIDINLIYQKGISDRSLFYKDLLIGSTGKTGSDLFLPRLPDALLKREANENISLTYRPELYIENLPLGQWSSRIFRFETRSASLCDFYRTPFRDEIVTVFNKSDMSIRDSFLIAGDKKIEIGTVFPGTEISIDLNEQKGETEKGESGDLGSIVSDLYLKPLMENQEIIFCGFLSDPYYPPRFSNTTWKMKSLSMVLSSLPAKGVFND
ncbi:MAG: hypothetical protein JXR86_16960 [Spirochaetales bacterium]|nr:hypothetical protein [Spirochaetales bacterium]